MRRYAELYPYFLRNQIKLILEYRADFIVGLVALFLVQGANLATLWVITRQVPTINGWTLPELVLIYGLIIFCRSFSHMFCENTWVIGHLIREGEFDRFLVRPIDPLFHTLASGMNWEGVGNFLLGGALLLTSGRALGIFSSWFNIAYLVVAVASGAVIFFALNLLTGSTAFWIIESIPVSAAVFENYLFAHYPLSIYPRAIQFLLTWIIPYGFASFYPAAFLLGRDLGPVVWLGPLVAAVLLALAYRLWLTGLERYEGTGS